MASSTTPPLEESSITYEQLGELEKEFEDAETEILRHQVQLTRPLYEKRHAIASQIPNFWPLVFEQAPPDIDEYMQPSDAQLLCSSLLSLTVRNFELEDNIPDGDPRSVAIRFEFSPNGHFEDRVIEKKFWHRRTRGGWSGLVSEPVDIKWQKGKDLTGGMLALVNKVWRQEKAAEEARVDGDDDAEARRRKKTKKKKNNKTNEAEGGEEKEEEEAAALEESRKLLKEKIDNTGLGGLSFFAWFGYRGRQVSAEENRLAVERENRRRAGEELEPLPEDVEDDDDDEYEIFPTGDDLAVCIVEDIWPGALRYFTQAQEQDTLSDADFESDDDDDNDDIQDHEMETNAEPRPNKKRKA